MSLVERTRELIATKSIDAVESLWIERMESDPSDVDDFLATAKSLRKAEERQRADALIELLAEALEQKGLWPQRLKVLKELARLSRKPANFRAPLEQALTKTYGARRGFKKVMAQVKFDEPNANPAEKTEKAETWLQFDEGEAFFMSGRGAGVVVELNPDLGVCRLDFERDKRVSVPLGAAQKFLVALPPGHLLREKIENPDALRERATKQAAETFARLLQSFGRPMTAGEVKDAMIGIVPDAKWSSWWNAARKHPQIVISGTGAKATYSWKESSEHADQSIVEEFDRSSLRDKLDLARKHSSRSSELADYFSSHLAEEAAKISRAESAFAWEILTVLERLPGKYEAPIDPAGLLTGPVAAKIVAAVSDRQLRERAIREVRDHHPEWAKILGELFFYDDDPRIHTLIMSLLEEAGETEVRDRLVDETLRYPRRHPKAFYWYAKELSEREQLPDRANYAFLQQILDALTSDEFASVRPRIREFFDKGALAIRILLSSDNEEGARKLSDTIERYGGIEEYRRENVKAAIHMKYPNLREPQVEAIYATPEALVAKRTELDHLLKEEIPANSKAIQVAREMGDLRENFEYKAARQRAEYLSARVGTLQSEIARVKVLDPATVDTSEVRIGTKVSLSNGDVKRDVTILGPWESSPEQGIYSNQSEAAKALLGKHTGEIVSFMGNDYEILSIAPWK